MASGLPAKTVLMLSPLAVLVDLDHWLVPHSTFHNIFLPLAAIFALRNDKQKAFIAGFFLLSHLLFDIHFGIALFYPLDTTHYGISLNATAYPQNTLPEFHLDVFSYPHESKAAEVYEQTWLSSPIFAMALLTAATFYVKKKFI